MTEIEIVPATTIRGAQVAVAMRDADRAEVWASHHHDPLAAVLRSLRHSTAAWAGLVDGHCACVFGVGSGQLIGEVGSPWMLGTDLIDRHATAFLRRNKAYVEAMLGMYPILTNWVDARNERSIAWLRWLGFSVAPAQPFGPEGLPFHPFEMRRGDV